MAAMAFREPNQVRWVGTRPGHNGSQVAASGSANNATAVVYTVTAGKTLHITHWTCEGNASATGGVCQLEIENAAGVQQYIILKMGFNAVGQMLGVGNLAYPLEVPAGYKVAVVSSAATMTVNAFVHGWEE